MTTDTRKITLTVENIPDKYFAMVLQWVSQASVNIGQAVTPPSDIKINMEVKKTTNQ